MMKKSVRIFWIYEQRIIEESDYLAVRIRCLTKHMYVSLSCTVIRTIYKLELIFLYHQINEYIIMK